MSAPALVAKAVRDLARLAACDRDGWVRSADGVSEAVTRIPAAAFNVIWVHGATGPAVAASLTRVAQTRLPFSVRIVDPADPATLELIGTFGLGVAEAQIVLGRDVASPCAPRDGVRVTVMAPSDALTHQSITAAGFGMPAELAALVGRPALFEDATVRGYLAADDGDGAAAATAMMILDGELASVQAVATLPTHRRRGLAAAVVGAAVADARRAGARRVILNPTAEGEPLYRRLGFTELVSWATLSTP